MVSCRPLRQRLAILFRPQPSSTASPSCTDQPGAPSISTYFVESVGGDRFRSHLPDPAFARWYWFGAPGVGTSPFTCAPSACARVNGPDSVIPLPDTCASTACGCVSGADTVIDVAPNRLIESTSAVSESAPLSIVIVCPSRNPFAFDTGITLAPAAVAVPTLAAPAVPTVAIVAFSWSAPEPIITASPGSNPATLDTLMLFVPTTAPTDSVA